MMRKSFIVCSMFIWALYFVSCGDRAKTKNEAQGVIPVYNVKDFGIKGDGVTDDGPAIQALLDSVMDRPEGLRHVRGSCRLRG